MELRQTEYLDHECIRCLAKKLIIKKSNPTMPVYEEMEYLTCQACGQQQMRFKPINKLTSFSSHTQTPRTQDDNTRKLV